MLRQSVMSSKTRSKLFMKHKFFSFYDQRQKKNSLGVHLKDTQTQVIADKFLFLLHVPIPTKKKHKYPALIKKIY